MEKKMKLQATPATLQPKEASTEQGDAKRELTEQEQCELRNELIRRRYYLFATLSEEAGEVNQMIGKILRFGEQDYHPKTDNVPNIELLHEELNDLFAVAVMLGWKPDQPKITEKQKKVERFWNYAKRGGSRGLNS